MQDLAEILAAGSDAARLAALVVMETMQFDVEGVNTIVAAAGALPALAQFSGPQNGLTNLMAMSAFRKLARSASGVGAGPLCQGLLAAGAVAPLLEQLCSGRGSGKDMLSYMAVESLQQLLQHATEQQVDAIVASGAVPRLLDAMRSSRGGTCFCVASAIGALVSRHRKANCAAMVAAGALPVLIDELSDLDKRAVCETVIVALSKSAEQRPTVVAALTVAAAQGEAMPRAAAARLLLKRLGVEGH